LRDARQAPPASSPPTRRGPAPPGPATFVARRIDPAGSRRVGYRRSRPTEKENRTVNKVLLTGRLTRDPEMRNLASGKSVTQFAVATNSYRGGAEKAEYHNVVTWDRLAEICGQYLGKGQLVSIIGRLQTRQWEDADKKRHC
jgi:hypothetical protein